MTWLECFLIGMIIGFVCMRIYLSCRGDRRI